MPDNVNVVYSNAQSNVFHLTFVNNKGLAEIPYEIKQQTIKLVGTRVVTTTTGIHTNSSLEPIGLGLINP